MIGQFFSINASNIGHAAMRAVFIAVDSGMDCRLVSVTDDSAAEAGVLVTSTAGYRRMIPISEARVRACLSAEGIEETQRFVDDLAQQIRAAVVEAS